jgi:hypothetical protein
VAELRRSAEDERDPHIRCISGSRTAGLVRGALRLAVSNPCMVVRLSGLLCPVRIGWRLVLRHRMGPGRRRGPKFSVSVLGSCVRLRGLSGSSHVSKEEDAS